jgi:hypothetical protein
MNPGLIGLSGIEGMGDGPVAPPAPNGEPPAPPSGEGFEMKTWPDLTAAPTATKIAKGLVYAGTTLGGAYYYGWKGGVAGFFGSAAASSAAGALVYHRQPEPAYKLAWVLTAGLGAVAAAIAIPAWVMAERVR